MNNHRSCQDIKHVWLPVTKQLLGLQYQEDEVIWIVRIDQKTKSRWHTDLNRLERQHHYSTIVYNSIWILLSCSNKCLIWASYLVKIYVDFFIAIGHSRPRTIIPFTTVSRDNVHRFELNRKRQLHYSTIVYNSISILLYFSNKCLIW